MIKKILIVLVLFSIIVPLTTRAQTAQTIQDLLAQIEKLKQQIAALQGQTGTGSQQWCHTFNQNLSIGMSGSEVATLEEALFRDSGATTIVKGSGYYNDSLASAVSGFQIKYRPEILDPLGLKNPTGYFGEATRKKMNSLYGCNDKVPIPTPYPDKGIDLSVSNFELNADGPKALFCNRGSVQLNNFPLEIWINDVTRNFDLAGVLSPGACQAHQWYYATWDLTSGGNYHGVISVDPYGTYSEINETNNKVSADYGYNTQPPVPVPTQSLTVVSPNGGESWFRGATQRISWSWKTDVFVGQQFAIYLTPTNWSTQNPQLIIATGVAGTSYYDWEVGIAKNLVTGEKFAPSQSYYVAICAPSNFGGQVCDQSDSYFKIYDSYQTGNKPPVINNTEGPTTLKIGETGTWSVKASDPENGSLSYSVTWGDEAYTTTAGGATTMSKQEISQTSTFTHSYAYAGTYYPTFIVTDNSGQSAKTSLSVVVGNNNTQPFITVLSPSVGNMWAINSSYNIEWSDPQPIGSGYKIYLRHPSLISGGYGTIGETSEKKFTWVVGQTLEGGTLIPGNGYSIEITRVGAPGYLQDGFSAIFTITSGIIQPITPSIHVQMPNGGETLHLGANESISWTVSPAGAVDISLRALTSGRIYTIASNVQPGGNGTGTGFFMGWSPSMNTWEPNNDFVVRVCRTGTAICDESDAPLKIVNQ